MKLTEDNPFSLGYIAEYDSGESSLERRRLVYDKSLGDVFHQVGDGDTLWNLAFRYYKDSHWWWLINDTNKEIVNPFDLVVGTTLLIPDLIAIKALYL